MHEGPSFHGSGKTGRSDQRIAALVVLLVVAGVGLAIAKPWGSAATPVPSARPSLADVAPPTAPPPTPGHEVPSLAPSANVGPRPFAFTTPLQSAPTTWTGLDWRRVAPDDPISLVASVLHWRRGWVAVGSVGQPPATPVWASNDGSHWEALPFNTPTTFWPGVAVLGVVELPTGLVALTEVVECNQPCSSILVPVPWTSPDGRTWTPNGLPPTWLASAPAQPPLLAVGPAGLIVASSGPAAHLATSTDGSVWQDLPTSSLPATFWLSDLRGTPTGYVAVGRLTTSGAHQDAASLWSADGRHWSQVPIILPTAAANGLDSGSAVASLVVGRNGMIAVGRNVAMPGAALWWQSADGRHWLALPTFAPLGPTTCTGEGCGGEPNGVLIGDGDRIVALRGGTDAGVWTSTDGSTWRRLSQSGDIPGETARQAVLLPGGILLSDGATTWFGQAQGPQTANGWDRER